jgi:radical SAM superfamily enzyme YgiQ (UPF0313 family)
MKVLLIRPEPPNALLGLDPFFRVEPLGLEYLGEAIRRQGHQPIIIDNRVDHNVINLAKRVRPSVVGLSVLHALEFNQAIKIAETLRLLLPDAFIVAGGPAAACYSLPLETPAFDAVCLEDGELVFPALVHAVDKKESLSEVAGLRLRSNDEWIPTPQSPERSSLDRIPLPARDLVQRYRRNYYCLQLRPVWLIETARGCPFRCNFCSVWQLYDQSFRERSIEAVVEDFASTGENIFVIDDLFWNHAGRSQELAEALKKKGIHKNWILVQSRADLVTRHADLLRAWRPLAKHFDIFFGFESASDAALENIAKDARVIQTIEAARIARSMEYGVTGNFLVDPNWEEADFRELWDFVACHGFHRAGYTILTPIPGTEFFHKLAPILEGQPWHKYDMSHLLWEPALGVRRFFELYAETWKRSILNTAGQKKLGDWIQQVRFRDLAHIIRIMKRTQRLMKLDAYLDANTDPLLPRSQLEHHKSV